MSLTDDQKSFILKNYKKISSRQIAKKLNCSRSEIEKFIRTPSAEVRVSSPASHTKLIRYLLLCFDYILVPALIIIIAYQPHFIHGYIDEYESGKELAPINEILLGKIPYLETRMGFGPLYVYLQTLSLMLFGINVAVLKAFHFVGSLVTLIMGYWIARMLCGRRVFSCLAAFALIIEMPHPIWAAAWGGFRFAFGLLAIACAINFFKKENHLWIFTAGVAASAALLNSLDVGLFSTATILFVCFFYTAYNFFQTRVIDLKNITYYLAGIFAAMSPMIIYFISKNVLPLYIEDILTITTKFMKAYGQPTQFNFMASLNPAGILKYDFKYALPVLLYVIAICYLSRRVIRKAITWKDYGVLCLTVYGILEYKSAFRALTGPQYQMAFQPALILGIVFLDIVFDRIVVLRRRATVSKNRNTKLTAYTLILAFGFFYVIFSEKKFDGNLKGWLAYQKNKKVLVPAAERVMPITDYFDKNSETDWVPLTIDRGKGVMVPKWQFDQIEGITNYILSNTKPDEVIFTFPDLGMYNFFANRPCLDRYNIAVSAFITEKDSQRLLSDLKEKKPLYIIYGRYLSVLAFSLKRSEELLPEVREYIDSHYTQEAVFGDTDILRRVDS